MSMMTKKARALLTELFLTHIVWYVLGFNNKLNNYNMFKAHVCPWPGLRKSAEWFKQKGVFSVQLWTGKLLKRTSSTAKELQLLRVGTQRGCCHRLAPRCVLSSYVHVDKLDLPFFFRVGADEPKYLFEDAQTQSISVDGPSYSHPYQTMRGGQDIEATRLQVGTQAQTLVLR